MIGSICLPFGPFGSGAFMMSSTSSFCQAVSAQATPKASALMISLLRSSSRWSTTESRSS